MPRGPRRWVGIGVAAALIVVAAGSWFAFVRNRPPGTNDGRPNILLIVTDDQRAAGSMRFMPRTRAWFADSGTTFTEAFATTPLCCPSRASFLSGLYMHNHGLDGTDLRPGTLRAAESLFFPAALQASGYRTGVFGKYLNEWPNDVNPAGFDEWATTPIVQYTGAAWNLDGTISTVEQNSTPFIADRSLEFFDQPETRDRPWFALVAFMAPHPPAISEDRYAQAFVPPVPMGPALMEQQRGDKPEYVRRDPLPTVAEIEERRMPQIRSLMAVDDQIDRLMRRLDELGELGSTLAIFASDNGHLWGEHGLFRKSAPYEPAVHVPLMARWPDHIPAGVIDDRLVGLIDIAPTIYEAAGVRPTVTPDGDSLLRPGSRRRLLLEFHHVATVPSWDAIRGRTWIYIQYRDRSGAIDDREFYDLVRDPDELVNILRDGDPGNDPDVAALSSQLGSLRSCRAASCPHG
jgi:arylsulfatase A-like enzyme